MKGLELSEKYCVEIVLPAIEMECPEIISRIAVGLVGEGSDCFGYDDEISRDHDWGPGCCIWINDEDDKKYGDRIQQIYNGLSKSFMDFKGRNETEGGKNRVGVWSISEFFQFYTGLPEGPKTLNQWLSTPEHYLAVVTNGKVFYDSIGEFSKVRNRLLNYYPEDIRRKKIAARAAAMAQSGQYNFMRCLAHGERVAAQQALGEFINNCISIVYLLNKKYMPFYKWAHRGLKNIPILSNSYDLLYELCIISKDITKRNIIEELSTSVINELVKQKLISNNSSFLMDHCEEIISGINDPEIRAMHFMIG